MTGRSLPTLVGLLVLSCVACTNAMADANTSVDPATPRLESLTARFISAFSRGSVEVMLEQVSEDVELVSLVEAVASVDVSGKTALRNFLVRYFGRVSDARSELEWTQVSGSRVVALERVTWTSTTGRLSRRSLSVYEYKDGKIRRVWYFPAEPATVPASPAR